MAFESEDLYLFQLFVDVFLFYFLLFLAQISGSLLYRLLISLWDFPSIFPSMRNCRIQENFLAISSQELIFYLSMYVRPSLSAVILSMAVIYSIPQHTSIWLLGILKSQSINSVLNLNFLYFMRSRVPENVPRFSIVLFCIMCLTKNTQSYTIYSSDKNDHCNIIICLKV